MKLYYSPGACSLSPHIALHEAGLTHELVKVDLRAKKTESGADYTQINPKGQVPAIELDNGELLTEGPVILQMIADTATDKHLAPPAGSSERYRLQEWLNFTTTELHKNFSPLFQPVIPDDVKAFFKDRLMGKTFSVADGYLFVMLAWADRMNFDLSGLPNLMAYKARIAARPNVQAALKMEGLLKAA